MSGRTRGRRQHPGEARSEASPSQLFVVPSGPCQEPDGVEPAQIASAAVPDLATPCPPADLDPARGLPAAGPCSGELQPSVAPARAPAARADLADLVNDLARRTEKAAHNGGDWYSVLAQFSALLKQEDEKFGPLDPDVVNVPLAGFPILPSEAYAFLVLNRIVSRRIEEGFYARRLIVLACQEKTSSTLHEVALLQMLNHAAGVACVVPMPRTLLARHGFCSGPAGLTGGASFNNHWLHYMPNGGVARGIFVPHGLTFMFIRLLGCKLLVLTRHPADRLVAYAGMCYNSLVADAKSDALESIFDHLIDGDILWRDSLDWLAGWCALVGQETAHCGVIRYEEMASDPLRHFASIYDFLFGGEMSESLRQGIQGSVASSGNKGAIQSGNASTRYYPKGYTGRAGVWRDYFTPRNVEHFNQVVSRFLNSHPQADLVAKVYPDLVLKP